MRGITIRLARSALQLRARPIKFLIHGAWRASIVATQSHIAVSPSTIAPTMVAISLRNASIGTAISFCSRPKQHHAVYGREEAACRHAEFSRRAVWKQRSERVVDVPKQIHLFVDRPFRHRLVRRHPVPKQRAPQFEIFGGEIAVGDRDAHQRLARRGRALAGRGRAASSRKLLATPPAGSIRPYRRRDYRPRRWRRRFPAPVPASSGRLIRLRIHFVPPPGSVLLEISLVFPVL